MLRERISSSIVGIIMIAGCIWAGGWALKGFFLALGIIGIYEFFSMMNAKGMKGFATPTYLLFLVISLAGSMAEYFLLNVFIILIIYMGDLFTDFREERMPELALSLTAALYLGFGMYFAMEISSLPDYLPVIILAFVLTWSSDVGGYAIGMKMGKHKMAPALSPAKSWEGAAGCIMFTIIASIAYSEITGQGGWLLWFLLGLLASVAAQMGDLLESALKRYFGVKDSGSLIPGHGGVLDRFDSFIFVLPLVYFATVLGGKLAA